MFTEKVNERKYNSFLKYDFDNDEKFHQYVTALEPNPNMTNILKHMKNYYKEYVDKNFDVNYDPDEEDEKNAPPETDNKAEENKEQKNVKPEPKERKSLPWITKFQLMFFVVFLSTFPIGFLAKLYYHVVPLFIAFIFGLFKKYGFIKFNREYWYRMITDDHFHNAIETVI